MKYKIGYYNELFDDIESFAHCDIVFKTWKEVKTHGRKGNVLVLSSIISLMDILAMDFLLTLKDCEMSVEFLNK